MCEVWKARDTRVDRRGRDQVHGGPIRLDGKYLSKSCCVPLYSSRRPLQRSAPSVIDRCILLTRLASLTFCLAGAIGAQDSGKFGIFEGASDVGSPSQKGSFTYDAAKKEYRVTGGGNNIWMTKDDFYFVWKKLSGDVILTANLKIDSPGADHRKAGLMIRKGLESGSPYADMMVHGSGLTGLQWREKEDDITRGVHFPILGPARIRIERRRNTITVWAGKEGTPFQEVGSTDVNVGTPVYVGLAVCPHDDKASLTAVFSDVTLETPPPSPAPQQGQKKKKQ